MTALDRASSHLVRVRVGGLGLGLGLGLGAGLGLDLGLGLGLGSGLGLGVGQGEQPPGRAQQGVISGQQWPEREQARLGGARVG